MTFLQRPLRLGFMWLEGLMDRVFGTAWNPLYHLGALGFFYFWIVVVSGIYVYILFDTGTTEAYESVEYMTYEQWYLGGVMRSLHRYASDGMVLMMAVHMLREFALDRYRGKRWFTWVTGVPVLLLTLAAGITGYWMVWDKLAQYVAIATTEWLDWLPIFGGSIARNFLAQDILDDRFFTLLTFMHIFVPLALLFMLWIHLQRVSRPKINPARGLAVGTFVMLIALSFVLPAESQGPADLGKVPAVVGLDWFYLAGYPLLDMWSGGTLWAFAGCLTVMLAALPWMPPLRRVPAAAVDLDNCNGCTRCAEDCPFNAITMAPRSDALPFEREAAVDPALCVSCGICAGACPTSTPFRRASDLVPGIDLPHRSLSALREDLESAAAGLSSRTRVILFGCDHGVALDQLDAQGVAVLSLPCIAALPPSFIDYALSRDLADGVFITGCREGECYHRFGVQWTEGRLGRQRDPYLRARVPREKIGKFWAAPTERRQLLREIEAFVAQLEELRRESSHTGEPGAARAARFRRWPVVVRALRYAGQAAFYLGTAALLGLFSSAPAYLHFPPDQAQIKISIAHSAQRKEACRRLTADEIAELAPNMRKQLSCSRERLPIRLEVTLDGEVLTSETLSPTGLSGDGPARLYKGIAVSPGSHHLVLRMRDSARTEGFDYLYDDVVELEAQQNLVVDFRAESGGFILR